MKKVLSVMAVSGLVLAGGTCFAAGTGMYVKGLAGYVMPSDPSIGIFNVESDNGYGFGAAVGAMMDQFRLEAEIASQKTDIEAVGIIADVENSIGSGDIRMTTYMVNGYFDIPVNPQFGMYITGGLGYGTTTVSIENIDGDDSGLAWKAGAGVFYNFNDNMALDLGWTYMTMDDADLDVPVSDLASNNLYTAFRFSF